MDINTFIFEQALILVPALYVLGMILKGWNLIPDNFIPTILLIFGIVGALAIMGVKIGSTSAEVANAIIQGVLVTGAAVLGNQMWKQSKKKNVQDSGEEDTE